MPTDSISSSPILSSRPTLKPNPNTYPILKLIWILTLALTSNREF